jgi:hypothetical protein
MSTPKQKDANVDRAIYQLQKDITHGEVAVSVLLRRALVLAHAKGDAQFEAWIRRELDGYDQFDADVPDYRRVHCTLHALNPYRGWLPVQFEEPRDAVRWSSRHDVQSIEALERVVAAAARGGSGNLRMNLPPEAESELAKSSSLPYSGYAQFVPSTGLDHILCAVRNRLLDWTMQFDVHCEEAKNKEDAVSRPGGATPQPATITTVINGDNTRVNVNSTDQSTNIAARTTTQADELPRFRSNEAREVAIMLSQIPPGERVLQLQRPSGNPSMPVIETEVRLELDDLDGVLQRNAVTFRILSSDYNVPIPLHTIKPPWKSTYGWRVYADVDLRKNSRGELVAIPLRR